MSSTEPHQRCAGSLYTLKQLLASRPRQQRRTVLLALCITLIFVVFMAYQNFSPIDEDDYHPIQGRFLRNKHLKDENFNKLRSHDALIGYFKAKERSMRHNIIIPSRNISSAGFNNASSSANPCNCSSAQSQYLYPFSSFRDKIEDSFSIIILTYNRTDLLLRLLNHYCAMPHLERVIVVWNCLEMAPPAEEWEQLGPHPVPVEFKVQQENRLRNRLQVFPEITSSAIFLVDDDLLISARDIQFAFRVWKTFPHLIVGFYPRKHVQSPTTGLYSYGSDELDSLTDLGSLSYSMILTGAAFVHKQYIGMFNDHRVVPRAVHDLVDSRQNCEDIAMNVMVGQYLLGETGRQLCSGLFVKPVQLQNLERETSKAVLYVATVLCSGYKGLWRDPAHLAERSHCLNRLAAIYGGSPLPLVYSDLAMVPTQRAMTKWTQLL